MSKREITQKQKRFIDPYFLRSDMYEDLFYQEQLTLEELDDRTWNNLRRELGI